MELVFCQIWEAVDNPQGYLTRTGLYKALALTALAQQGKSINDKILESFSDQGKFTIRGNKILFRDSPFFRMDFQIRTKLGLVLET